MSHVDDGELTAYADGAYPANDPVALRIGAHLSTCENCRTRLEQAHALRDRAAEVLGYATPARVQAPPAFESLEAQLATPAPRPRRPIPLAWAASIIMALGLGWFGRGFWQNPPAGSDVAVSDALRAESQMQSAAPQPEVTNQEERSVQPGTGSAASAAPRPAPVQPPPVAAAEMRRERAPERAQAEQDMSDRAGFAGRAAGNARAAAAPPAAAEAPKVTMESIAAAPIMRGELITAAEAERRGLDVPRIPALPIARVVLNGDTTSVVHTLPDGRLVTLTSTSDPARQALAQRDAAAEAGAAAPQMAKTAGPVPIVVRVRGHVVRVTGDVSADSLRNLAAKIR